MHKSLIAELRPARRKITWNQQVSDWDKKPNHYPKIRGLQVHELHGISLPSSLKSASFNQIHAVKRDSHQSDKARPILDRIKEILQSPGDHVDELEQRLEDCFKTIRRVKNESETNQSTVNDLQQACTQAREQLAQLPIPPRQLPMRQAQQQLVTTKAHLEEKRAELEEQIGMLRMQHSLLAADIAMAKELMQAEDMSRAIKLLNACFKATRPCDSVEAYSCAEVTKAPMASDILNGRELDCKSRRQAPRLSNSSLDEYGLDFKQRTPSTPAAA
jgi:hypothetical protein